MRILIADDDDMVRLVIREVLAQNGHVLEEACSGEEAVGKSQSSFDLFLLDHHMPGMNGAEAAIAIRAANPQARIVLLTGSSSPEELKQLAGFEIFFKPFSASELLKLL